MKDVVCIYSGGMDSYTLAGLARAQGRLHSCLSFNYDQRHQKEIDFARAVCADWKVEHRELYVQALHQVAEGSALAGYELNPLPEGVASDDAAQKSTIVPNRNMIMLSIATAYAVSRQLKEVWFGAHAGDRVIYPDCREEFVEKIDSLTRLANDHSVRIRAPFLDITKVGIIQLGNSLGLNYFNTWTCYAGDELPCGRCGSCTERLDAFAVLGIKDPVRYAE